MEPIIIYTDGACSNNQDPENSIGGWAYLLKYKGHTKEGSGRAVKTTNNRMEMQAVIEALKVIKNKSIKTIVHSDSALIVNTINEGWKKNKNQDLWEQMLDEIDQFEHITFVKVKGHANDEDNNRVDELAVIQTKR